MHLFKMNDTCAMHLKYCMIHERMFMVQQVLSMVNGPEQNKSKHSVRGTCFDSQSS